MGQVCQLPSTVTTTTTTSNVLKNRFHPAQHPTRKLYSMLSSSSASGGDGVCVFATTRPRERNTPRPVKLALVPHFASLERSQPTFAILVLNNNWLDAPFSYRYILLTSMVNNEAFSVSEDRVYLLYIQHRGTSIHTYCRIAHTYCS